MWTLLCHKSQLTCQTPIGLIVYKYVSSVCKSKRCSHNNNIVLYACTEVKMSMYPPRNVHAQVQKWFTGQLHNIRSLKAYVSSQERSQVQKRFTQHLYCTERVPILPETFANPKKVLTTVALHWSQKECLSSQKRSQIQKRFSQQLHCTEVKKSAYPPRNVRKSKKGSHNSCTALK